VDEHPCCALIVALNSPPRKNIADIAETAAIVVRSRAAVTAGVALDLSFSFDQN